MFLNTVTTGSERREFNGPVLMPIWDGNAGWREGQLAYDADGIIDPDAGPSLICWDGTQWVLIGAGDGSVWGINDGFPDAKLLPAIGDVPATLVQVYDQYTRTITSYSAATTKIGGGAITDADLGPIYIKDPETGTYYVRNFEGAVFPRWWGATADGATDDSAAWEAAINFAAPLSIVIDGENRSYKVANIDLAEKADIQNARFVLTNGAYGLKINDIGQSPTVYKRDLRLFNITFTGQCTYALIVSTITGITIDRLFFESLTCANDAFYLLNVYDSQVSNLRFTGVNVGATNACLNMPAGINGMKIDTVYTSAFTAYGVKLAGGSAIVLSNFTIQGAVTGIYFTGCLGITVETPYFENTVNPVIIDSAESDPGSIRFHGGTWFSPYDSHPQIAQNNGVYIKYTGGRNGITLFGGVYDVGTTSNKKLASVGASGVVNIFRPHLITGGNTPDVTDYLFKEATALSSAGYYVEYTGAANAYTVVRRTADIGNEHIVERFDSGANLLRASWNVPTIGSAAVSLTFYHIRVNTVSPGSLTLNIGQDVMRFNTTSAPLIATLPVTGVPTGKIFVIKKTVAANTLTVTCSGGVVTIDGATSIIMRDLGQTLFVQWDGTAYIVLANGSGTNDIANQFTSLQAASFAITGTGGASKFIASNPDSASFQQYFVLGRDPIDATKFLWAIGTTGVPTAPGGPGGNAGQTLNILSYTNTGGALATVLTMSRGGALTINGALTTGGGITTPALGNIKSGGTIEAASGLFHAGGFFQNSVVTVEGDYTAQTSDLYINVNNSAPCTITIQQISSAQAVGRLWYVKKISNNAFPVNIVVGGVGTPTIDGAAQPYVISGYNDSVMLHDDGTNWYVYAKVVSTQTPTLQQVATAGNTFTGSITVSGLVNNGPVAGSLSVVSDGETLGDYLTAIGSTASAAATLTLPTGLTANRMYYVRRSSPANSLTLNTSGSDAFNDGTTTMNVNNAVIVQLQGSTWWVLSSF